MSTPTPQSLEAKIVVLGAAGVGKTSLLTRFIAGTFTPPALATSTVGATFLTKRLVSPDDAATTLRLQIWDTAGQERFRSISKLYYRGANAALLCYDITDEKSFVEMTRWLEELGENLAGEDCIVHVVGTKADVVAREPWRREVPFERCVRYIAEHMQHCGGIGGTANLASSVASVASSSRAGIANTSMGPPPPVPPKEKHTHQRQPSTSSQPPRLPHSQTAAAAAAAASLNLWAQDTSWSSCHEISAKDNEGVDEVFQVIARKLIEQQHARRLRAADDAAAAASRQRACASGVVGDGKGSFRVGMGDKRRSWLGFPVGGGSGSEAGGRGGSVDAGSEGGAAGGGAAAASSASSVGVGRAALGQRQGRCC